MSDFPFRIVGFDLDGTLIDTAGDLTAAVNHALARIDRAPLAETMVRPMIGLGARHMLEQGLIATGGVPAEDFDRLLGELLAYYEAHIAIESRPYPGLIAALDALEARGVRCAVATNKAEHMARKLLGELELADRMAAIVGGDTLSVRKPAPDPIIAMIERSGGGRTPKLAEKRRDLMGAPGTRV
ncbi:MAG: HAD hydrolase-like protein, partial [Sphingopyxis sp.]